ncbi:MAG TPA: CpsD/CapB family tyrosine-protein kinase, partial [Tepidisphaeraceae bacterium]|nr:CpsD/CapB family tyrosine-protein kinase [Tepidisphaeraceae bacterium]
SGSTSTKTEAVEQLPLLASLPALPDSSVESAAWATQLDPTGNYARAVRVLRRSVEIENSLPATFVFAPIASGDGATTVASNLAMLLAREGRKIILVDLGFGQSSIEQALDLKSSDESDKSLGLADALTGAELISTIRTTSIPGLDAMPAGTLAEQTDARALLDSPKMGELITHLAAAYDHVIFDAPAIDEGDNTRLVAALADATVIVGRAGSTSRSDLIEARNSLQMLGANVIGLVIRNDSAGRNS